MANFLPTSIHSTNQRQRNKYGDQITKKTSAAFGGYNHNLYAQDGEIWDEQNMSSDEYPLLAPRKPRYLIEQISTPNGFYAHDGLYWVDGTVFVADGTMVGTVEDSRKSFVSLGAYIVIMPDKKYYNRLTGDFGSIEASVSPASAKIQDGTYAGETAEANTIYAASIDWADYFKVGDAVTISGATGHARNNTEVSLIRPIIREISGHYLRFYENTFTISSGGDTETGLTISRDMPDMDFMCENENRLWGCKGDMIYSSKQGDIFNWYVMDSIASDSYQVQVGSVGDFTGCCSFLGYPIFFKEETIYKVYGERPATFQVMSSASLGTEEGASRSFGIAGETLFYLSRIGIVAYSGGIPQSIAAPFGGVRYRNAVGGSDGQKYYVSMQDPDGTWDLFVFDTRSNLWIREDDKQILDFGWNGELYFLDSEGNLWMNGNARTVPVGATQEDSVDSFAEFNDFIESDPNMKGVSKIQLRIDMDEGAEVSIEIQYDTSGVWQNVANLAADVKRSYYLPIIPRRCDHFRLKFIGTGMWHLYSLVRESYSGSEIKGRGYR